MSNKVHRARGSRTLIGLMNIDTFKDDKGRINLENKSRYNYQDNTSGPHIDLRYNLAITFTQRGIMLKITNGLGYHTLDHFNEQYSHAPDNRRLKLKLEYMDELTSGTISPKLMKLDASCFLKNEYYFNPRESQRQKKIAHAIGTMISLHDNIGLTFVTKQENNISP